MITLKENHEKIKWVVSITIILFIGSLIFFSIKIISEIKEREITAIKRYANFLQYISSNKESPDYYIDEIIIDNNNIPVIVTDENYNIIDQWNYYVKYPIFSIAFHKQVPDLRIEKQIPHLR